MSNYELHQSERVNTTARTGRKFQVVIWRDRPESGTYLQRFLDLNTCYKCYAEHEGEKTGRPHFHCYCRFKTPRNWASFLKSWGENGCRIMDGDDYDNAKYISRDGTLDSFHEEGSKKRYNEQNTAVVVDGLLQSGQSIRDIIAEHVELRGYINQNKWVLQEAERAYAEKRSRECYEGPGELYPWQRHVLRRIQADPHPRHIDWYMDTQGNVGKSEMTDLLVAQHGAIEWKPTGHDRDCSFQLLNAANKKPPNLIVCDLENGEARHVCWAALERAKNGKCMTNKYEGGSYRGKRPHVLVFSNENPLSCPLTGERLHVYEIKDKDIISERTI